MKNKQFQNLILDLKSIKMTQDEKADVLQSSLNMIEKMESMYAVTPDNIGPVEKTIGRVKSNFYTNFYPNWAYFSKNSFAGSLAVLALLIGTGGISLAAESSLPGDALYTVKVNINESAKSLVAITPEAKAKFALEIADKRLKEVALLSQKGRLNNQTGLILTKQLAKQADQVKFQVASLVSTNDLKSAQEIALNFESSLRAHELILEKISTNYASSSAENIEKLAQLDSLISTLKSEIATTTLARNNIQNKEIASVAGSEDRAKIELRISEVRSKLADLTLQSSSSTLSESSASTTRKYIAEATRLVRFANDKLAKSMLQESMSLIQSAFQYANDAEVVLATNITSDDVLRGSSLQAIESGITMSLSTLSTSSTEVIRTASVADDLSQSSSTASTTPQLTNTASTTQAESNPQ
jgi:hypothetical protein